MAARGWANSTVTAIGAAAGTGAAQLGLGYGLGIIAWQPVRDAAGESLWLTSLSWVAWIAASSAVLGAIYANARGSAAAAAGNRAPAGGVLELVWRTAIALAAAIGASIVVPLVMLPARVARRPDTFQPQVTAGVYVVVGIMVGLVIAIAAVNARVIAANVALSVTWVWLLAVLSVVDAEHAKRTVGTAELAVWQFTEGGWIGETLYLPGTLLMLGGALLVGALAALPADRRGANRVVIALSGAVGPALVAAAYFLAAPDVTVRGGLLSAYLFAPYAVIAGLAGSVLVAALGPLRPRRARPTAAPVSPPVTGTVAPTRTSATAAATAATATATADDRELGDWTQTLADNEPKPPSGGDPGRPPADRPPADRDETTLRLDARGTDPQTVAAATDDAAADAAGSTATGRAAVTQPLWPERSKSRKRRGAGGRDS